MCRQVPGGGNSADNAHKDAAGAPAPPPEGQTADGGPPLHHLHSLGQGRLKYDGAEAPADIQGLMTRGPFSRRRSIEYYSLPAVVKVLPQRRPLHLCCAMHTHSRKFDAMHSLAETFCDTER
jgi:hypothetical protein